VTLCTVVLRTRCPSEGDPRRQGQPAEATPAAPLCRQSQDHRPQRRRGAPHRLPRRATQLPSFGQVRHRRTHARRQAAARLLSVQESFAGKLTSAAGARAGVELWNRTRAEWLARTGGAPRPSGPRRAVLRCGPPHVASLATCLLASRARHARCSNDVTYTELLESTAPFPKPVPLGVRAAAARSASRAPSAHRCRRRRRSWTFWWSAGWTTGFTRERPAPSPALNPLERREMTRRRGRPVAPPHSKVQQLAPPPKSRLPDPAPVLLPPAVAAELAQNALPPLGNTGPKRRGRPPGVTAAVMRERAAAAAAAAAAAREQAVAPPVTPPSAPPPPKARGRAPRKPPPPPAAAARALPPLLRARTLCALR